MAHSEQLHKPGMLREMVGDATQLYMDGEYLRAWYKYDVPVNEYDIPVRDTFVQFVVSAASGRTQWLGIADNHHLAWPRSDYFAVSPNEYGDIGRKYRSMRSLQVRMPRQMHEFAHVGFHEPPMPSVDVMAQYIGEVAQCSELFSILKPTPSEVAGGVIDEMLELGRLARYLDRLDRMADGEVGHFPETSYLATLTAQEARTTLAPMINILDYNRALANQ